LIAYIFFELPSNMLIVQIGPAIWFSCIAFAWRALSLGLGFVNLWQALTVTGAFLGVLEADIITANFADDHTVRSSLLSRMHLSHRFPVQTLGTPNDSRESLPRPRSPAPRTPFLSVKFAGKRWIIIIEATMVAAIAAHSIFSTRSQTDSQQKQNEPSCKPD
jgi:hypothetical protein